MFKKFNMLRAACGTGAISLLSMLPLSYAQAVDCKLCEDLSVQEVLEYSAELDSDAVRHQFRGWLAEHYPNTAEGIAAKAWIVGRNGASQAEVEKLYRQALAKDGSISLALVNMAVALNNQEKYEQAIEILALIIDEDWTAKWNTFFYLRSAGEGELAMQKLDEWKQDSNNHLWVPYFLEAWLARQDGDYQEANRLYLEGMYAATEQEQSLNAFTLARWLKNSRDLDNRQGRSTASRQKTFQRAFEFATYSVTPMAFEEAARYAEDQLNNNNAAARARIEGIKFLALPELVSGVVFDLGNTNMPLAMQALEEGKKDFPFNYDVAITEHETYTRFNFDTGIASAALARAMENTTSNFTLKEVASYALGRATRLQDFSGSKALMAEVLPKLDDDNKRSLLGTYLTNRIAAKDFAEAELILDQLASLNTSKTYLNKRQDLLTHFSALVNERNDWLNDQPFLKDWEQRFGDSLRASIEFNTGSSQLLARSNSTIKNAASALNAPGGEAYVFKIEGHTDSTGSDKVNIPLSKARADAVKAALVAQFGVDAARIQTAGYGDNHPIAPNLFSEGRKQNRRVEIRPLGNISDPQIATPGAYDTDYMEISRDGRYAVMGHSPTQIWDLKRQVVVHEIKAGLHHRFSPNGRYLASLSSFTRRGGDTQHVAYIYDVRSGKLVDYLWGTESFQYFDWSPFSDKLLTSTISGDLRVYDVATRKVSQMARPYTSRNAAVVMWSNNGQEIVLKSARQGDRITVLDAETLEPKTNIDERTWAHSFGQSTDGKYAMISQDGNGFVIFDTTQNWKPIHKGSLPLTGGRIYSHPTKPWVMLQAKFETKVQLLLLDISTGKTLASTRLKTNGGGFNIDGSRFITGVDNDLVELDTLTLQKTATSSSRSALAKGLAQIEEKQLIVSSDLNGSSVWSLKTGRRVHTFDTVPSSNWQNLKSTPNKLITVEDENKLVVFDGETFLTTTVWSTKESIQSFATSGDLVVLATVPAGSKNKQINSPYVTLHTLDAHTFKPIKSIKTPLVNGSLRNAPYSFDATITLNGEVVALHTSYSDGFGRRIIDERLVKIFNVLTGEEIGRVSRNYAIENFQLIDNNQALKVRGSGGYQIIDIATNKHTKNEPFNPSYQLTLKDGQTVDWFWDRVSTGKGKALTFPFSLHRLVGSSDNNLLVGQTKTGKIHFIDLKQLETVLTITPFSNGEWLAYTPEGNYTASLHGTEGVYWSLGDNYLPFDALASKFERPNIVKKQLSQVLSGKEVTEEKTIIIAPEVFDAPYSVKLLSEPRGTTSSETYTLKLQINKDSASLPDPEFIYTLNGREVAKSRGFEEEAFFDETERVTLSRKFSLRSGINEISASLMWKGAKVSEQKVVIERKIQTVAQKQARNLWFFGVGISEYEIASQNLEFADKDALSLASLLEDQAQGLFSSVHTQVLTNSEATERNVRVEMNEFLSQASPDDVVIVFVAGHGVTDSEQELYLATHDAELSRPYTGMNVDKIRSFLENRPLNQSALLLLDICHSGAAGRVVSDDAVQKLSEGTGAIVFASSSGSQLAYEDTAYGGGHGAFTAALLEALKGLADKDTGNRDGLNSLQEMIIYTSSEVPRLTRGLQRPTIPMMAQGIDYPISLASD